MRAGKHNFEKPIPFGAIIAVLLVRMIFVLRSRFGQQAGRQKREVTESPNLGLYSGCKQQRKKGRT